MDISTVLTIPNLLSVARIVLAVPIYYLLSAQSNEAALIVIVIAAVSDALDGYFARKLNLISDLGKILDPLADKACTTAGFLALSIFQGFPLWITLIVVGRDILIMLGAMFIIGKKNIVLPSNRIGKITVFLIALTGLIYILRIEAIIFPLEILILIFVLLSGINYLRVFVQNIGTKNDS